MDIIKKYKFIIAIVLTIIIMVLIRSFDGNHFKSDAKKWAEPSFTLSNIIPTEKIGTLTGEKLIIKIGEETMGIDDIGTETLNITPDSILSKNILSAIRKHVGPVLLVSSEMAVSARIWMVLSQLGYDNILIVTKDTDNEILKYKFRPDTLVRPEL